MEYGQLLFLYAYLRQIDLSLDRSRWTSLDELQSYFKRRLQPAQIIGYLKRNFRLSETDLRQFVFFPEKKTFRGKLRSMIAKSLFLRQDEILYCCKLLWAFDKELKSDTKKYNLEIEKLRIDVARYYTEILESMISNKDLNKLMRIEHYEQNDKIEVIEMNEFIPDDF